MKLNEKKIGSVHEYRHYILAVALATTALATAACSSKPQAKVEAAQPAQATLKSASLPIAAPNQSIAKPIEAKSVEKAVVKQPTSKTLRYRSRDYAVSFEYPWQYSFVNAKKISEDEELQPKVDGQDGQVTLARVELPKGFYPDTNFESGYFILSLNPSLDEHSCKAVLESEKHGAVKTTKINDTDFFWVESEEGGHGKASKVQNYVAFTNDVCYELELGVKTQNQNGLARDVNVDQVMRKLNAIANSVTIGTADAKPASNELQSSAEQAKTEGQK